MVLKSRDLFLEVLQCGGNLSVDQLNTLMSHVNELNNELEGSRRNATCCLTNESRRIETI